MRTGWSRGLMRGLTSWPALAAFALAAVVLGIFGLQRLQQQISVRALESAELSSRLINTLVAGQNISVREITTTIDPESRDTMDGSVFLLKRRGELSGLRVWALSDGHQVY